MLLINEYKIKQSKEKIVKMKKEYDELIDFNGIKISQMEVKLNEDKYRKDMYILKLEDELYKIKQKYKNNKEKLVFKNCNLHFTEKNNQVNNKNSKKIKLYPENLLMEQNECTGN